MTNFRSLASHETNTKGNNFKLNLNLLLIIHDKIMFFRKEKVQNNFKLKFYLKKIQIMF